jgi:acetyl-CoA carboxylase biotin carboxylase subunit
VGVYSTADRDSLHVTYADDDVCIGPPASGQSYLNITSLVSAAEITGADAVHPGYGFLAENAYFAEVLADCGLGWIGPPPEVIRLMGDKAKARQTAAAAGVPVLPGSGDPLTSVEEARVLAADVGFPVILKAAAGGGGRGMRIVRSAPELEKAFDTAAHEAEKAFGDGSVYLEKYLEEPRHIEFQVFGDRYGNVIHLGERECSIQRRHQKLIEEAPSPALTPELRDRMGEAAVRLCAHVGYQNAGTVEFLLDHDGSYYFMEMNTRIQVEHPVTEMVTGVDLVKLQITVAAGERLTVRSGLAPRGHAIECRINAEDPVSFAPCPGRLTTFHVPGGPGVRVDTHGYEDYVIPPYYDSLVAKLIAHGRDRAEAIARMRRALGFFVVEGIKTTIPLHREILDDAVFRSGRLSTRFMEGFQARRERAEEGR